MAQTNEEMCDFPFSIRIPKSMAQDINRRATAEGMKAATWARKALEYALYQMGSDERKISAASLIELLKYDSDVKGALRDMFNEFMNSDLVVCDEDGNVVDLEDRPISPLKRIASWLHRDDDSLNLPDHIDEIHLEYRDTESISCKTDSRERKKAEKSHDAGMFDSNHKNAC